jgi:LmbE family N-acetylglucosaminyl deacetylase
MPTTLVFAPHPDDDILACGGTIALRVQAGQEVWVVYLTDGQMSHASVFGIHEAPTPAELGIRRRQEAVDATAILGVPKERLVFLGYTDGSLENAKHFALQTIEPLLTRLRPAEVFYPSIDDPHPDHVATSWAVSRALRNRHPHARTYQYCVSDRTTAADHRSVSIDIAATLAVKRLALEQHRSQVTALFPVQPRPVLPQALLEKYLSEKEHFDRAATFTPARLKALLKSAVRRSVRRLQAAS